MVSPDGKYLAYLKDRTAIAVMDLKSGKEKTVLDKSEREKAELLAADKGAWLNMLEEGATTTFEAWGKNQKWNTSLFHPWATAPLIVFAKDTEVY